MVMEYWINGLISGPQTHITYTIGNTLLACKNGTGDGISRRHRPDPQVNGTRRRDREDRRARRRPAWHQVRLLPAVESAIKATETGVTTLLPGEEPSRLFTCRRSPWVANS